ncbi:unnamed protein product [Meloidogyne enterolobii]|uniref:Uncharacterized protein n=1 Tax=Meloidogyne enterolobii TaxID=390850 RepID=A0ACB0XTV9_MELEN
MKLISVLFFLIFNSILWSLINSVKNNKNKDELIRVEETLKNLNEILNNGAESSSAAQNQKYEETLKPKAKIAKMETTRNNEEERGIYRNEYMKDYYQKNKERFSEYRRKNKEKRRQTAKKYYQKNKKRIIEKNTENKKKYRLRKKIEKESQQNDKSIVENVNFDNNKGTSFVNPQNNDCENKGKELTVSKENVQLDQGNICCVRYLRKFKIIFI